MTLYGSTYKRLMLVILLALSALASAMAQGGMVVTEGETRIYQVDHHTGSSYNWVIYKESTFKTAALNTEALIITGENTSSLSVNWLKSGTYYPTVVETDQTGCTNTKAIVIQVNKVNVLGPIARISNPTVLIGNSKYIVSNACQSLTLDASTSTGDGLNFSWSPSIYLDNATSSKPKFHAGIKTRYHLTVTDREGQKDTTSILVVVASPPKAVTDKNVFVKTPNVPILLNGSKSSGVGLTYLWLSKEGIILSGITQATAEVSGLGMYYLSVTDLYGCIARDSVNVGIYIQAISDTAKTKFNESVVINVLKNDIPQNAIDPSSISIKTPPSHGTASITDDLLVLYQPEKDYTGQDEFVYSICDYFSNCDNAKVLVLINDMPLFIPEAFSPNGDGINDEFEIKGLAKYKTVEIEIFNRWGNVVYQSATYGDGYGKTGFWNGKASSSMRVGSGPVASGTYYYVLKMNGHENISGAVYLDR